MTNARPSPLDDPVTRYEGISNVAGVIEVLDYRPKKYFLDEMRV